MKQLILLPALNIGMLQLNNPAQKDNILKTDFTNVSSNEKEFSINGQTREGSTKMQAAVFKAQEYCRAELKDFEFDVQYKVVSAAVYFSGDNFKIVEKGMLNSNSLKPIRSQMDRCIPGSIVIFDEVKVIGPDNKVRTIPGISLMLI